jgi:hypothetical protein
MPIAAAGLRIAVAPANRWLFSSYIAAFNWAAVRRIAAMLTFVASFALITSEVNRPKTRPPAYRQSS